MKNRHRSLKLTEKAKEIIETSKDILLKSMAQAYYLPNSLKINLQDTAKIIGVSSRTVLRYRKRFEEFINENRPLKLKGGSRYRAFLSVEDEKKFIDGLYSDGAKGLLPTLSEIRRRLSIFVGREVSESGTYRLLKRHGWRKIKPRPSNPKADKAAQDDFKKTT